MVSDSDIHHFNESDDSHEDYDFSRARVDVAGCILAVVIIVGIITNVLGVSFVARCRMWLKHEGYVYLVAIFATNIGVLIFNSTTYCLSHFHHRNFPGHYSEFMCKVWYFFMSILFAIGWLSVALLFNVFLREQLVNPRRCGCPIFAKKYCTLFASKIIVGIIFGVVFIFGLPYMGIVSLYSSLYGGVCASNSRDVLKLLMAVEFILMWGLPFVFCVIILLLPLCLRRERNQSGCSQIEERSAADAKFRTLGITIACVTCFSQIVFSIVSLFLSGVKGLSFLNFLTQGLFAFCLGLQPVLCLILLKNWRDEILQQLRSAGCCKGLNGNTYAPETQTVRLQETHDKV